MPWVGSLPRDQDEDRRNNDCYTALHIDSTRLQPAGAGLAPARAPGAQHLEYPADPGRAVRLDSKSSRVTFGMQESSTFDDNWRAHASGPRVLGSRWDLAKSSLYLNPI